MATQKEIEEHIKKQAKNLVLHCFRNTHLENIHAGESGGGVSEGFGDEEMKKLMIEAVDKTYTFLLCMTGYRKFGSKMAWWIDANYPKDWNEPKENEEFYA